MRPALLLVAWILALARPVLAERPRMEAPALYTQACAVCHGADGKGSPTWQGATPVPNFSDCLGTTAEPAEHWQAIISGGGAARGLSSAMPAFGDALDPSEIRELSPRRASRAREKRRPQPP